MLNVSNVVTLAKELESYSAENICNEFYKIGTEQSAEIFTYFTVETKEKVILQIDSKFLTDVIEYLYTDDINELLDDTTVEVQEKFKNAMSKYKKLQLHVQESFEEQTAGALMSMDFIQLLEDDTALEALDKIKSQEKIAEIISYCYVINKQNHLIGAISMKEILLAPDNELIQNIMNIDLISVDVDDDQEFVAQQISKYDMDAIPVVDDQHRILGIITIDDVLDIIEEEVTEDIQKMGGITPTEGDYLTMPIMDIVKSRIVWILILMISATISGTIINMNTAITMQLPTLLVFMPMLMDTAGNAGSQSSAMVIRGIVVDDLGIKHFYQILKKEFISSILLGSILLVVNMLRIVIFMPDVDFGVGLLVSITVFIIVIIANLIGGLLPIIAVYFKIDPASMSSPVLSTICDAISLSIYFALAAVYLGGIL